MKITLALTRKEYENILKTYKNVFKEKNPKYDDVVAYIKECAIDEPENILGMKVTVED